jgi:hypothetical protein
MASAVLDGGGVRHRPVFAYPVQAMYDGRGDLNDPASFTGRMPATLRDDHYAWAGSAPHGRSGEHDDTARARYTVPADDAWRTSTGLTCRRDG